MANDEIVIDVKINGDTADLEALEAYMSSLQGQAQATGDAMSSMALIQAGQALEQYGSQAESMASNLNNTNIMIEQLGVTAGHSSEEVRGLMANITNETFNYEEATAFSTALTQMGTSFENLGAQATNLDKLNDSFHLGTQGTIQLANEMNVLGVSANNMESSFNALAYANSNTIGGMGQFKTMMQRFNVDMRDAGLNIDQAAVAIAGATHKFGGGRAAMTNFSNALKNANGDLSVLEKELGLEAGALTNASQATGQYAGKLDELAQAEMNNKTIGERLTALWQDLETQNHAVVGSAYEMVSAFGMIAGTGAQLNGLVQLFNSLRNAEIGAAIASKVKAAAELVSTGVSKGMAAAQALLNAVMSANPIMLVVIALAALTAALVWAYYNVDWFREMVDNAFASLVQIGQQIYSFVTPAIQWLSDLFNQFTSQLGLNTNDWLQSILGFILFIPTLPLQVGIALANTLAKALGFGDNFVQRLVSAGANAVNGFVNYIRQIPQMVLGEFQRTLQLVNDFINTLPDRVWDMGTAIIDALKGALGIGSPGHMFYMVEGEFNRIDDLTKKTNFDTGSIGQSMVDSFNPSLQTGNAGLTGSSGNNITINIDSVDNEERVQQIVKAVEDALKFDNLKAGRTV